MRKISLLLAIYLFSIVTINAQNSDVTEGTLYAMDKKGEIMGQSPLKHTKVKADISGFLARVTVEQEFENNFNQPIEAIYTFPLSENSAVDRMTMKIGSRTIHGKIKRREEAKKIYEEAKAQGKTASLLNQERPNIFTQAVANILPNEKIVIEISYVETLKYKDGNYEFVFPMVVGPRYSPASTKKTEVAKVTPPIAKTRAGHDVSIEINLDAGIPIEHISSTLHQVVIQNLSSNSAKIQLLDGGTIPNKDFILKYDVTGKRIEDAILTHRSTNGGFFTMMLSPPENFNTKDVSPKEIVFVLDTSGSMSGFPIEKAKEAMNMSLAGLYPNDTFNLITFAGDTSILFDKPVSATPENLAKAKEFLSSKRGGGGTEMMKAVKTALEPSDSKEHIRIVNFMTDGYVSNDSAIISEIQKHPNARVFAFGIGNSVNRFLLDKMSQEGRGEVEYVSLDDDGSVAAKRFHERIRNPLLTDISIDWNGMPVEDVYPKRNPDLFDAKPIMIYGRYKKGATGTINLKGKIGGQNFERLIQVNLPESEKDHDVLATLWARTRIDDLMSQMRLADEKTGKKLQETITNLGLDFQLLTQFTSFVAVEEIVRTEGGKSVTVEVPVELPEGVNMPTVQNNEELNGRIPGLTSSSNSHGFILQGWVSGNRRRNSRITSSEMADRPPTINSLELTVNSRTSTNNANSAVNNSIPDNSEIVIDGTEVTNTSSGTLSNILKRMKQHNDTLQSFNSNIQMQQYDSTLAISDTTQGTINYQSNDRNKPFVRIDWTKPGEETLLIKDDEYLLYRPRFKLGITGKVGDNESSELIALISMSKKDLLKKYKIQYLGVETVKTKQMWHLEIKPKKVKAYKSIEIWVDADGMIYQLKIIEQNDDWRNILLWEVKKNPTIEPSLFSLELPKGTKIVK